MDGTEVTILLVEDNIDHVQLITRSLKEHRMANRIFHVGDGDAALDYLFRRGAYGDHDKCPRPNLVLLDLRLPKLDGLDVLSEIRSSHEFRVLPVVALTTSDADRDIVRAYAEGVNSYLVKPLDFEKFSEMMTNLGFYWVLWNRYPW